MGALTSTSKTWILVVDDDPTIVSLFKDTLEEAGYRVLTALKIADATRMALNQKFDCLVIDYELQGATGDQLISSIKRNPAHLNFETPIVLVSGYFDNELLQKVGKNLRAALVKPFSPSVLSAKISSICGDPTPQSKAA